MTWVSMAGAFLVLLASPTVRAAETNDPAQNPPLVELGAGAFARYDFGTFCEQDIDVVSCTDGRAFVGVEAAPRLRLSRLVSLGAFGAFGWTLGSEGSVSSDGSRSERSMTTYHLDAEARFHPLESEAVDLWLGVAAGVSVLRDGWKSYAPNGELVGESVNTDAGAVLEVALGVDFRVMPFLALGPELRGALLSYDEAQFFASLAVAGTFLVEP